MRNFFDEMEPWARNDGSLHIHVLPGDDVCERLAVAQSLFADVPALPPMPAPYLHLTLQRLAHFDDGLKQAELSRLGSVLTDSLGKVSSFGLELGAPRSDGTAVVSTAAPSTAWDGLHAAVAAALGQVLPGELPIPPHAPHVSLAYATGEVPDDEITARLADAEPIGTLHVGAVHLVSVTVRPEVGIFDFTHLANWELA